MVNEKILLKKEKDWIQNHLNTSLFLSVKKGFEECVKILLEYNADSNFINSYGDKIVQLTKNKRIKKMLGIDSFHNNNMEHKKIANVDSLDEYERAPIFNILWNENQENVHKKLLDIILDGADLDINHGNMRYPIRQSVATLDHKATEMLISYGADIGVKEIENQSWRNEYGNPPLFMAASYKDLEMIRLLMEGNVYKITEKDMITSICFILSEGEFGFNEDLFHFTLDQIKNANINQIINEDEETLLFCAAFSNPQMIPDLVKKGARVDLLNKHKQTVIHKIDDDWKEIENIGYIMEVLLQHGCDSNQIDNVYGKSAFHYAIDFDPDDENLSKEEYKMIKFFLKYGANPNITTHDGIHPLQMVKNSLKLTTLLKEYGAILIE